MKVFGSPIMGRHIGGSFLMFNPIHGTPILHRFRNQFAIVTYENFKAVICLVYHSVMPQLQDRCRFILRSQRQALNIT
jgi:hypothetical protein